MPDAEPLPPPDNALHDARHPTPSAQALQPAALPPPRPDRRAGRPWGPWATAGWTVLLLVVWYALQFGLALAAGVVLVIAEAAFGTATIHSFYANNRGLVSVAMLLAAAMPTLGLVLLLSTVRGMSIRQYLALTRPTPKETFGWLMGCLALIVTMDIGLRLAGINPVTDYEVTLYTTTPALPLLFALVVLAPVLEETWWRGFVYRGLAASKAGPLGAVLLTAVPFALMHTQYEWPHRLTVLGIGLYLAAVRWRSGSTVLAMFCHAAINVFYFASTATEVHWLR